jgi:hypothetical protein
VQKKIDATELVTKAANLPLVKIDRKDFLVKNFSNIAPKDIDRILELGPVAAGISLETIDKIANDCINFEAAKVTGLSFVAGIPGGFAMIGTIPADLVQFYAHVFRISQKLAYLYGFPDISNIGDSTNNIYILFLGVMSGVEAAVGAVRAVFAPTAGAVAKRLAAKPLTKRVIYPIVKTVAIKLGHRMTKEIFSKGVGKIVPVVGGVISAGLTLPTYKIMAHKLHKHLKEMSELSIKNDNIVADTLCTGNRERSCPIL